METDLIYFRRRASEERTAAVRAPDARAQHAHLEMAERYDEKVRTAAHEEGRRLHVVA